MSASPHRRRLAEATRDRILAAAREVFPRAGFAATTIEAIAGHAGVGISTVYAVFGSKRGILDAMTERWANDPERDASWREARAEADPEARLARVAVATRRQWESAGDLVAIHADARREPGAHDRGATTDALDVTRRRELGRLVEGLSSHLRAGLGMDEATAIVHALTRRETYAELVATHRWSTERYEAWLAATLTQQLLG